MSNKPVDYEKMYHKMVNAFEDAIEILVNAQCECEEIYLEATDTPEEKAQREEELHQNFLKVIELSGVKVVDPDLQDNFDEVSG